MGELGSVTMVFEFFCTFENVLNKKYTNKKESITTYKGMNVLNMMSLNTTFWVELQSDWRKFNNFNVYSRNETEN